jgi:hypothetical protein
METLVANLAGRTRRERWLGRDYVVAPLTLIVPGVLPGSKGPLYYPPDEVAREPDSWNHVPIVVYHPIFNGSPTTARRPDVLEKQGVGYVFNAGYRGKLRAEGWFDIERTKAVDPRVLLALEKGEPFELSTGLYTDNEPAPGGSVFNGASGPRPYTYIARNYRPDHLAVLPDRKGACSVADGCGVLVNEAGTYALDLDLGPVLTTEPVANTALTGGKWITLHGSPVYIKDGKVVGGAAHLRGVYVKEKGSPATKTGIKTTTAGKGTASGTKASPKAAPKKAPSTPTLAHPVAVVPTGWQKFLHKVKEGLKAGIVAFSRGQTYKAKVPSQQATRAVEKATARAVEKPVPKATEKAASKIEEKSVAKTIEKVTAKVDEKPVVKAQDQADKAVIDFYGKHARQLLASAHRLDENDIKAYTTHLDKHLTREQVVGLARHIDARHEGAKHEHVAEDAPKARAIESIRHTLERYGRGSALFNERMVLDGSYGRETPVNEAGACVLDLDLGPVSITNAKQLEGGSWVTIEGVHVYIKGGKIVAGPASLKGDSVASGSGGDSKVHATDKQAMIDKADVLEAKTNDTVSKAIAASKSAKDSKSHAHAAGLFADAHAASIEHADHLEKINPSISQIHGLRAAAAGYAKIAADHAAKAGGHEGTAQAQTTVTSRSAGRAPETHKTTVPTPSPKAGRSFEDVDEADQWGARHYSDWAGKLKSHEKEAVNSYIGPGFMDVNGFLRTGQHGGGALSKDKVATTISGLNSALNKTSAPEDFVAYRGVEGDFAKKLVETARSKGTLTDKGFMSMALSREVADEFLGSGYAEHSAVLQIHVPKGSKGAYIPLASDQAQDQSEWLAPAGSTLRLHGVSKGSGGVWHIKASLDHTPTHNAKAHDTSPPSAEGKHPPRTPHHPLDRFKWLGEEGVDVTADTSGAVGKGAQESGTADDTTGATRERGKESPLSNETDSISELGVLGYQLVINGTEEEASSLYFPGLDLLTANKLNPGHSIELCKEWTTVVAAINAAEKARSRLNKARSLSR